MHVYHYEKVLKASDKSEIVWFVSSVCNLRRNWPEVVSKMGILSQYSNVQNCIKKTNKIPEYARNYKKEWLFIRGINKEFKYFVDNIDEASSGLFENHRVDRIKKFIKKFLLSQERGKLQDTSNFEIKNIDIDYLIKIKKIFLILINILIFVNLVMMMMMLLLLILILVLKIFMMILNYFLVSLK